jgi:hypothetical protein
MTEEGPARRPRRVDVQALVARANARRDPNARDGMRMGMIDGDYADAIAFRIRAELVCCDIYEKIRKEALEINKSAESVDLSRSEGDGPTSFGVQGAIGRAILRRDWHDLCYWGEAAAQIAEGRCPGYETSPNICRCPCEGCMSNCAAHQGS